MLDFRREWKDNKINCENKDKKSSNKKIKEYINNKCKSIIKKIAMGIVISYSRLGYNPISHAY